MKTENIKNELNLDGEWKRERKVKDNKGNVVREFKNEDENCYLFVVTDPSDEKIILKSYLDNYTEVSTEELKDSSWPWSKYVFCYNDECVFVTEYVYWRNKHFAQDCEGLLNSDVVEHLNVIEAMDGCFAISIVPENMAQRFKMA